MSRSFAPRYLCLIGAAVFGLASGFAQTPPPFLYSVTNSASYDTRRLAQGSLVVLFGSGMGPAVGVEATTYPLPPQLGGTSVTVISGGVTLNCPMVYASSTLVKAILPSNTPTG